jgi:N12 class adenine-specific DNA methylase
MTMYVENIIRDLNDLIFDVKAAGVRAYENRRDAERSLSNAVYEEDKNIRKAYDKASDSLVDASSALESANDDFLNIEQMLRKIIEDIQMETLSAKVQGK